MPSMMEQVVFWCGIGIQALGWGSVLLARLSERSWAQAVGQYLFVLCLLAVGMVTLISLGCGHSIWLSTAATFSWMAVAATLDLGPPRRATAV